MFRRPTCMESCQAHHDYEYCYFWCNPPTLVPTYPYLIPTAHQAPAVPYGLNQATPYSSNLSPFHTYGGMNDGWECYRQCRRSGGSAASCCYYCGVC